MKLRTKLILLGLLSLACLYCLRASFLEVEAGDYWSWGESDTPPRPWVIMLGLPCMLILLWSVGWAFGLVMKFMVARHYGLKE